MRLTSLLLGLLVCGACSSTPAAPGPLGVQVVLAPGQSTRIPDTSNQLRFVTVLSDSRCPANALCIHAGDALVRVEVIDPVRDRKAYDLHTNDSQSVRHDDVTITLVELSPYPYAGQPIGSDDYRATLRVDRR